jgi:hypothetical protein
VRKPSFLDGLAALFAVYMFVRHLPGTRALIRAVLRREPSPGPMAIVSAVNVALAVAILTYSVTVFLVGVISR